jgi:small subunit ribosomal protein S18
MAFSRTDDDDRGGKFGRGSDRSDKGEKGDKGDKGAAFGRRKGCRFCAEGAAQPDYKNPTMLKSFLTDRGKLTPGRVTGTCAKHQRALATAVRRARMIALVPFTVTGR